MRDVEEDILKIQNWESYHWPLAAMPIDGGSSETDTPIQNIKEALDYALKFKLDPFVASSLFEDVPDPCIKLKVGVNSPDAELRMPVENGQVHELSQSFNSEPRPDNLIFAQDKVLIDNPQWDTWLRKTAMASLHNSLGISLEENSFTCRLKFFSICTETSGSFHDFAYRVQRNRRHYGTLTVILPSVEGHNGKFIYHYDLKIKKVIKTEIAACTTSLHALAIGAYHDLNCASLPGVSGCIPVLRYDVLYTGNMATSIPRSPCAKWKKGRGLLSSAFEAWRDALDGKSKNIKSSDAPQVLVCLLHEKYDMQSEKFTVASLRGSDRELLLHLAFLAKGDNFDLHLGEAIYVEEGWPLTRHRFYGSTGTIFSVTDGFLHRGDQDDEEEEREGMEDQEDGEISEAESDIEMEEVDRSHFLLEKITTLNGVPLTMDCPELATLKDCKRELRGYSSGSCDYARFVIGGILKEGDPENDLDRFQAYSDGGWLTQTWRRKSVLITPTDSSRTKFALPTDTVDKAYRLLDTSDSTLPSKEELIALDTALRSLRGLSLIEIGSEISARVASCLRVVIAWKNENVFVHMLRECGDHIISWMSVQYLVKGYRTFRWQRVKHLYSKAVTSDISIRLRRELLAEMHAVATNAGDAEVIAWFDSQSEAFVENIHGFRIEMDEVDAVISAVKGRNDPLEVICNILLPNLHKKQPSDMRMWATLFESLRKDSSFDQGQLYQVITDCIQHLSSTFQPFSQSDLHSAIQQTVEHVANFISLCIAYDSFDTVPFFLQRLWDSSTSAELAVRIGYFNALLPQLHTCLDKDAPELNNSFDEFFGKVFDLLLFNHSSERHGNLQIASRYLYNPVGRLSECLSPERLEELARKDDHTLEDVAKFVHIYCASANSGSRARLQDILQLCLDARLATFKPSESDGSKALNFIDLCFATDLRPTISRGFETYLNTPGSSQSNYIQSQLVTILKGLPELLKSYGQPMTDTYLDFAVEVVKRYDWNSIGCGCVDCQMLVSMLHDPKPGAKNSFRRRFEVRQHLETQLTHMRCWGVSFVVVGGNPKTGKDPVMRVNIPPKLTLLPAWFKKLEEAQRLLELFGDVVHQKQALGEDYWWIAGMMTGKKRPPPPSCDPGSSKKARSYFPLVTTSYDLRYMGFPTPNPFVVQNADGFLAAATAWTGLQRLKLDIITLLYAVVADGSYEVDRKHL
ncbi:2og-fe oxygenase [Moniliophthora roreri MCA 2997]|uniref:2og-fe oxygenase n=1 Tax=Moniliophthora roreri (strain MCA 2997) TaxID=1381753 RepID=V2XLG1_MONRO|nr:2og-fe oxygenase [Moniliophthora roreri MCA 2997]